MKEDLLDISVTLPFGVNKKYLKIYVNLKKAIKLWEKNFVFLDKCIWIGLVKFSQYLTSAVDVLTNNRKISDLSKRDMFKLNSSLID